MARYQPKVMQHPAWYLTAPVSGSQVPLNSGPPCEVGSMADLQAYQNQLFLPAYVNSAYPSLPVANLQQNNAMPLLTYARNGGSSFDYAKPFAYVQALPRALLGQPLPHMQAAHYEYPSACYPHFVRSHPYFVRRSSSASSQNNTGEMGPTASESGSSHINNHSSTGRGSCSFQPNVVLNSDKHRSRSSSNGSNQNSSPAVSVNNTVVSDSPLWLNDNSLLNSETVSNTADLDEPSMQSREHESGPLHQIDPTELLEDGKASKSSGLSGPTDEKDSTNLEQKDSEYQNMGDHPSVIGCSSTGPATSKSQTLMFGTQADASFMTSTFSGHCLRSDRFGIEKTEISQDDTASLHRHHHQSNSLPVSTVGRTPSQISSIMTASSRGLQMVSNGPLIPPGAPLSFASAQPNISSSLYMEALSLTIWQFYTRTRQSKAKYAKKVHLRNALLEVVSGVFKHAGLFIVGSSMNGFGSDQSDMDMCLTVTSQYLQQKKEAFAVLSQLLPPLRNCSFIRNLNLIRAKVPILKFRDTLAGVDCDLNVNNVVGIYNTHLLAMYTKIDWRVRPLGMFVKYWAQRMDIHDGSRGRLSTYPLLLMLIHYLQAACTPPILPNLQAKFPKIFNYACPLAELDMRLELPWAELRSNNPASLAELFVGFIHYYTNEFDFSRWAVSVRNGAPLPIDMAIRRLPPHEQAHTARSFKVFVEEPFCQSNAARSLYDDNVLSRIRQAFVKTHQALRAQQPLESIWVNTTNEVV